MTPPDPTPAEYNPVKAMAALIEAIRDAGDDEALTEILLDAFTERTRALLRRLVPQRMADDMADEAAHDIDFLGEQLTTYLTADETARADMAAFHDGDGLDMIRTAIVTTEAEQIANAPTAEELRRMTEEGPTRDA